jgi:hypothetical protein
VLPALLLVDRQHGDQGGRGQVAEGGEELPDVGPLPLLPDPPQPLLG